MDLCERSVQRPEVWVFRSWWEQEDLDLEGLKERATAGSYGEETQCEEGGGAGRDAGPGQRVGRTKVST